MAKLISYVNGAVLMENREGKRIKVPLGKLSEADQEYVEQWRKNK